MKDQAEKKVKTPFQLEFEKGEMGNMGGQPMNKAVINLIQGRKDVKNRVANPEIYSKEYTEKIRVYFGIKGTGKNLLNNFMKVYNEYRNK